MQKFRIYPDGHVVHEDDFDEYDEAHSPHDDFEEGYVPDEVVAYLSDTRYTWVVDELEFVRSRVLRRLRAEVSLLGDALHALQSDPPKLRVVEDHITRVLDSLKEEVKALES